MASIGQIRGMLLEEAILYLLRNSGYKAVESAGTDPTLHAGSSGMEVVGRGVNHQIDAIADFLLPQPFTNPQRLLVEAKCYTDKKIGVEHIRNAVGVLKDVSEYFIPEVGAGALSQTRYHYQYSFFSATSFTSTAQKYAFAQDINLIPLARSAFFCEVIEAIYALKTKTFNPDGRENIEIDLSELRHYVREKLKNSISDTYGRPYWGEEVSEKLITFFESSRSIKVGLLAMIANRFPVFLVPNPSVHLSDLPTIIRVTIHWDKHGWYLRDSESGSDQNLFSFDLPEELLNLYAENGSLTKIRALDLKAQMFSGFHSYWVDSDGRIHLITFFLDENWLQRVRESLQT